MRTVLRPVILAATALALALPLPAVAQGADFYRQQLTFALRDLDKITYAINDLQDRLKGVSDRETGCRLLKSKVYELQRGQVQAEKVANYAAQLGEDEVHRAAVDQHNAFLENRRLSEQDLARNSC